MGSNLSGSTWGRMLSMQSGSSMELVWMIGSSGAWFVWSKLSPFLLPVHCKLKYCKLELIIQDWLGCRLCGRETVWERQDWGAGSTFENQISELVISFQVRDEYRTDFDSGRGGYGKIVQQKLETPDGLLWNISSFCEISISKYRRLELVF